MQVFDGEAIKRALAWPALIAALEEELRADRVVSPERPTFPVEVPGGAGASLLLMPAWIPGAAIGVKVVTFFPENGANGLPTINAGYLLFDGATGALRAVLDGDELTARRTAAASAVAAKHLARADAARLLVIGTGQLAANVVEAHCAVRPYREVRVYGRSAEKAAKVVSDLAAAGIVAEVAGDIEAGCRRADVISCVTSTAAPIVRGEWLRPGTHLDLIGSFRPDMRESDDGAVRRARIFVDTRAGASRAGDISQPIATGIIVLDDIEADLGDLVTARHPGRGSESEITLFKSAGFALEDLAAARLVCG